MRPVALAPVALGFAALCCTVPASAWAQDTGTGKGVDRGKSKPSVLRDSVFEHDRVDVQAPKGGAIGRVRIDNRLGDVSIRGHDKDSISIQSFKRALDRASLERLSVSLVPDADGGISVTTVLKPGQEGVAIPKGSVAVDLVVLVPRDAEVGAELWKGKLQVSHIDNGAQLTVDEGDISVQEVSGSIRSHLRRGRQEFERLQGSLDARGLGGELSMASIRGDRVFASLVRGQVYARDLHVKELMARSVFGDLTIEAEPLLGGRYEVVSKKGQVEFHILGKRSLSVEVQSGGKVMLAKELAATQIAKNRWEGRLVGEDKQPAHLQLRSDTGPVLVKTF